MSEISQKIENDSGSSKEQKASHWSELISKVIEKVIDKDVSVSYNFNHLEIDVPSAHGPGGRELGGAKWVIDGKITISTTSTHNNGSSANTSKYVTA